MTKRFRATRRQGSGRGQALVEFALILIPLLYVVFAIVDLGRGVYAYNTISNAARSAARQAIVNQNVAVVDATAVQSAVALAITTGNVTVAYELPDQSGPCSPVAFGCLAVVTVTYGYQPLTPLIGNIIGTIHMSSTTMMPIENPYSS